MEPNASIRVPSAAAPTKGPVALLLVHGVGRQQPGETLTKFLDGFRRAFPDGIVRRDEEVLAVATVGERTLRLYEVYWADLLSGPAVARTFRIDVAHELAWFPLLNRRAGLLDRKQYPDWLVVGWTALLVPLSVLLWAGYWGAKFVMALLSVLTERPTARPTGLPTGLPTGRRWLKSFGDALLAASEARRHAEHDALDRMLDDVAGDVTNYVDAAGGVMSDDHPLAGVSEGIVGRFRDTAARAVADGCTEIHVLAHSLGSVVAYHGLSRYRVDVDLPADPEATAGHATVPIVRLFTIGSPLEKIRFLWPGLARPDTSAPLVAAGGRTIAAGTLAADADRPFAWDNFYGLFDLVSGRLERFDQWATPSNHRLYFLGGLASAHIRYERHPRFLAEVGEVLTGRRPDVRVRLHERLLEAVRSIAEAVFVPAVLLALAVIGLVMFAAGGWTTGSIVGYPLEWLGLDGATRTMQTVFILLIMFISTVVGAINGLGRARKLHARHRAFIDAREAAAS